MQNKSKYLAFAISLLFLFQGCDRNPYDIDISNIALESEFIRFDTAFFNVDTTQLGAEIERLEQKYPPFFEGNTSLIYWRNQLEDPMQRKLHQAVMEKFSDFNQLNFELNQAAKHYYYYFGTQDTIDFYSYISRLDFEYPVLQAKDYCFAGLDLYLGKDAEFYRGMPEYLAYKRQQKFLIRDCMEALIRSHLKPKDKEGTLLDAMIYYGKILHALQRILPEEKPHNLVQYTEPGWQFCQKNEKMIWSFFVENQMLFQSTESLKRRFIREAPFSKFRTRFDNQTPGRIGRWLGWRIVESYARRNGDLAPLKEILNEKDSRKILRTSGYKPQ